MWTLLPCEFPQPPHSSQWNFGINSFTPQHVSTTWKGNKAKSDCCYVIWNNFLTIGSVGHVAKCSALILLLNKSNNDKNIDQQKMQMDVCNVAALLCLSGTHCFHSSSLTADCTFCEQSNCCFRNPEFCCFHHGTGSLVEFLNAPAYSLHETDVTVQHKTSLWIKRASLFSPRSIFGWWDLVAPVAGQLRHNLHALREHWKNTHKKHSCSLLPQTKSNSTTTFRLQMSYMSLFR